MCRIVPVMIFTVIMCLAGCGGSSSVVRQLDAADGLMESRPDSALIILDSIQTSALNEKSLRARYALLKSMALDKTYVDTTNFDILQPAIDYFLDNGTPDEKLRTYYYQGRIYQNRNDRDSALRAFMRSLDNVDECKDSLTIARSLVAQGILYKSFYDINSYTDSYLKAANIFHNKHIKSYEFECLLNILNGAVVLGKSDLADSIIKTLDKFDLQERSHIQRLHSHRISYILNFGSKQDLKTLIDNDSVQYDVNGILNLARAYNRLGDNYEAIRHLDYLDEVGAKYDTLKYLSIKYPIFEGLGRYEEALATYKDMSLKLETINSAKFEQKSRSMEERHRMELQAERDAQRHTKMLWILTGGIVCLLMIITIMVLIIRSNGMKKNLAEQKVITAELENESLKKESERLALENRNLQLERDNKVLEAENLAHRVEELESESEGLRDLLDSQKEMPEEVRKAIQTRIEMLNSYLASQISDHKEFEKTYDDWVAELTANTAEFMDSNRLAFQASHPAFIKYFEDHGLTVAEINYVCLYAIGLRGKDVGNYMRMRSHVNISSAIRRKLGIDRHETNIGIYVRKLLREL
ncbi:MAG: hypothetical protein K2H96_06125 [Muribaculaceae bacterium]|nr:hypothetical protein [Muribaculaceae bacterium]